MTLSVFHCVLTWHQEDTDAPMRLWLVFRGVVVLHTPAYFASHHPLFGSCDSWWVAFSACAQLMLERPVDQEETCGCERQMPGPYSAAHRVKPWVIYRMFAPPLPRGKLRGKWHVSLMVGVCQLQYTLGGDPWGWKTGTFVQCQLGFPPLSTW